MAVERWFLRPILSPYEGEIGSRRDGRVRAPRCCWPTDTDDDGDDDDDGGVEVHRVWKRGGWGA